MAKAPAETVWFQHTNGTIHEIVKGSEQHKRMAREMTVVDETSDEVPELVYKRLSEQELKRILSKPEDIPGPLMKRTPKKSDAPTVVVAGPSEDDIQARIDTAVKAAVEAALAATQTPAGTADNTPKGK